MGLFNQILILTWINCKVFYRNDFYAKIKDFILPCIVLGLIVFLLKVSFRLISGNYLLISPIVRWSPMRKRMKQHSRLSLFLYMEIQRTSLLMVKLFSLKISMWPPSYVSRYSSTYPKYLSIVQACVRHVSIIPTINCSNLSIGYLS